LSGHSFLPNDSELGDVECAIKRQQRLYTVEDYINTMKASRINKKFVITRMEGKDFVSIESLLKQIVNRKSDTCGEKISWLQAREISLRKDKPFSIFMRTSFSSSSASEIEIGKKSLGRRKNVFVPKLPSLWPSGKPLSVPKLADIRSLLPLVPIDCQALYLGLLSDDAIVDDVHSFSGVPDYNNENDED